jgi:uncharacterized protein YjbI with pentapeptide repeats
MSEIYGKQIGSDSNIRGYNHQFRECKFTNIDLVSANFQGAEL